MESLQRALRVGREAWLNSGAMMLTLHERLHLQQTALLSCRHTWLSRLDSDQSIDQDLCCAPAGLEADDNAAVPWWQAPPPPPRFGP